MESIIYLLRVMSFDSGDGLKSYLVFPPSFSSVVQSLLDILAAAPCDYQSSMCTQNAEIEV